MRFTFKDTSHIGDIVAIPFFGLLIYYFYNIENKSLFEYILYYFCVAGFVLDISFTCLFMKKTQCFNIFLFIFFYGAIKPLGKIDRFGLIPLSYYNIVVHNRQCINNRIWIVINRMLVKKKVTYANFIENIAFHIEAFMK